MKDIDIPVVAIIIIIVGSILGIVVAFLAQRKIHNQPLKKKRKRLLVALGVFALCSLIMTVICEIQGINIWKDLLFNTGFLLLLLLISIEFLYIYFRKDKK